VIRRRGRDGPDGRLIDMPEDVFPGRAHLLGIIMTF
jgi:hypothetical protein